MLFLPADLQDQPAGARPSGGVGPRLPPSLYFRTRNSGPIVRNSLLLPPYSIENLPCSQKHTTRMTKCGGWPITTPARRRRATRCVILPLVARRPLPRPLRLAGSRQRRSVHAKPPCPQLLHRLHRLLPQQLRLRLTPTRGLLISETVTRPWQSAQRMSPLLPVFRIRTCTGGPAQLATGKRPATSPTTSPHLHRRTRKSGDLSLRRSRPANQRV